MMLNSGDLYQYIVKWIITGPLTFPPKKNESAQLQRLLSCKPRPARKHVCFCWLVMEYSRCEPNHFSEVLGTSWTVVCRRRLAKVPWGHFLLMTQESRHPPVSWDLVGSWNFPLFIGFLGLIHLKKRAQDFSHQQLHMVGPWREAPPISQ